MARPSTATSPPPSRPTPSPPLDDLAAALEPLRRGLSPPALVFLEQVLGQNRELRTKLAEVQEAHRRLRAEHEALTAPTHYPAVVTDVHRNGTLTAEVCAGGVHLEVAVHPEIAPERLKIGARGRVAQARNCLLEILEAPPAWSEIATFDGWSGDGQLLVQYQGLLKKIRPADGFAPGKLRKGDSIGFDPEARLAFTRVENRDPGELFLEQTPADRFEDLGGLDRQIARIRRFLDFRLKHAAVADRYRLPTKRGILLHGAPGNGKTKLARAIAHYIATLAGAGVCRFMAIAGSGDYSMWLGQSEQRIRARFAAVREVALGEGVPVVMFWDEVDAIGRRRGSSFGGEAPDRILNTFLAELDGIAPLGNLLVIAATNRIDTLDPGLTRPGRLGDELIEIPPPSRAGARAILTGYLRDLPLRDELEAIVEPLLDRIYAANGEYAELNRVTLRDGRKVALGGRDLVSGAMLENVVRKAAEAAAVRAVGAGPDGLDLHDLAAALDQALRHAAGLLSPANVRSYVPRLPQDVDPVAVEVVPAASSPGLYVRGS
jgi:proteasome-associated ATPase